MEKENMQVSEDPLLLELMMKDGACAPDIYKTSNYWSFYERKFLRELKALGLHDFRRRKNSVLSSFRATDLTPLMSHIDLSKSKIFNNRITRKIPGWLKVTLLMQAFLNKILPVVDPYGVSVLGLKRLAYDFTRLMGKNAGCKSLDDFQASLIGNPEDIIEVGGKVYTMSILFFYLKYVYCASFMNFDNVEVMVELGCGSGKQIEIIKKLHPDICFFLFDIPPQLYVCEQYLSSVFPGSVVSYKDTRDMMTFPGVQKGKIFIMGNWKFPIIKDEKIDLFWNAASFQEMEPSIVANYLAYVNKCSNFVFLEEAMDGKEKATKEGKLGVLKQTKFEDYKNGLADFLLMDLSPARSPLGNSAVYSDSFWKRQS